MNKVFKILVADDSSIVQSTIAQMLMADEAGKYSIITANDGRQACSMAYSQRPDLIIIDIQMPVMDGTAAIGKIKKNIQIKKIPIIAMSSTLGFHDAFEAGADDFIIKPFNQYELLLRVQANIKLASRTSEIKKQTEIVKAQKQEVISQRDFVIKEKTELIDDLQYARFIQNAIMPEASHFEELFPKSFIFNRPKSIVSGDFYWVSRKKEMIVIAVGDCTGHGISGALMTMAGAAFLNEIVNTNNQLEADAILNELRIRVIKLLHQKGNVDEASNGMDAAVCIINTSNNSIQYAGANNPIYLVRKPQQLEILKADRMPIGIHINHERPFTKKEVQFNHDDTLYLFSDGYADQFGGLIGQKFRYNQFQELLVNASDLPVDEQYELIDTTMTRWMNGYEQIDDILIIGIQF